MFHYLHARGLVFNFLADALHVDVRSDHGPGLVAHAEHQAQRGVLERDVHVGDARGVLALYSQQLREGGDPREHERVIS